MIDCACGARGAYPRVYGKFPPSAKAEPMTVKIKTRDNRDAKCIAAYPEIVPNH